MDNSRKFYVTFNIYRHHGMVAEKERVEDVVLQELKTTLFSITNIEPTEDITFPIALVHSKLPKDENIPTYAKLVGKKCWYKPGFLVRNLNGTPVFFTEEEMTVVRNYLNKVIGYNGEDENPFVLNERQPL